MHEAPPYDGVKAMLKDLKKAGHRMFILTSNYKENIDLFLKQHQIEKLFTDVQTVGYATTWTKTRALNRMMRQYGMKDEDTYHVGNEVLDMRAAERVGIRGVATMWGGFDLAALKKTEPFAIIDQPKELVDLLQ